MLKEITKTEMIELWKKDLLYNIVQIDDKLYSKHGTYQDTPEGEVWCNLT